jgi:transposase InsO family protein
MPWKETSKVDQRRELVMRYLRGESMTALAKEYGISRKTGYKAVRRFEKYGEQAFFDRSRRPRRSPTQTAPEVVEALVALKKKYDWGAKKLHRLMPTHYPGLAVPSRTTIHHVLEQQGLVRKRRRRPKRGACVPGRLTEARHPNHVWCTDFKGQFRLAAGRGPYCYPLTLTDAHTRFITGCEALSSTAAEPCEEVFLEAFERYGLPEVIRSDNGVPFATTGLWGLSRLNVGWIRLGIRVERIEPGKPQQNSTHERMHRTLKREATRPSAPTLLQQQQRFDRFVHRFNQVRPHEALDMETPATRYQPSPQRLPHKAPELAYPLHDFTRTVGSCGTIRFVHRHRVYLTRALHGQTVGLRELDSGQWLVSFASLDLGRYCPSQRAFEPLNPYQPNSQELSQP